MTTRRTKSVLKTGASFAALSIALALSGGASAGALPDHGHYVEGHGTIGKGNQSVTVKQSSTTGIINWNSFSVGKNDAVIFHNGHGATLNRVTGSNLSTIAGRLHASGSLYLMNNAGVIISGTGRVVTGGNFVATSGSISNTAFDDGKRKFAGAKGAVVNKGSIVAGSGAGLIGGTVDQAGTIRASSVRLGGINGTTISGSITARQANGAGGTIIATGRKVDVTGTARISASGTTGGTVLIGGDIHGGAISSQDFYGKKIRDAHNTTIAAGARVSANGSSGTGGNIVIWSDGHTSFNGNLSATGRTGGGFAEVSSHRLLGFTGRVDLLASHGATGELLLDPENVVIEDAATANGSFDNGNPDAFIPSADDSILNVGDLEAALSGADVIVTSGSTGSQAGDITVLSPLTWSDHTLTLDAYHSVNIDAKVQANTDAALALFSNDGGSGGDIFFNNGGRIAFVGYGNGDATHLAINGDQYTLENDVTHLASAIGSDPVGAFALADNYDASGDGTYATSPITTGFAGEFEGLGNTVSNLTIDDTTNSENLGFFAHVDGGLVRDIGLSNLSLTSTGTGSAVGGLVGLAEGSTSISGSHVSGSINVAASTIAGGLVGDFLGGSVTNSYSTASVAATTAGTIGGFVGESQSTTYDNDYATGAVSGTGATVVGGFAGGLDSANTLTGDYATGAVTVLSGDAGGFAGYSTTTNISDSHATGTVTSTGNNGFTGGFVGVATNGSIQTSFATGAVNADGSSTQAGGFVANNSGTTISKSYASGDVTGAGDGDIIGGFLGENLNNGSISQSYASGEVSGIIDANAGGFAGFNNGTIAQAYATGNVSAGATSQIGGFAGNNGAAGTIDESYSLGKASAGGGSTIGGFVGGNGNSGGIAVSVNDYYNLTANPGSAIGSFPGTDPHIHGLTFASMFNSVNYQGWTFGTSTSGTDWVVVDLDGSFNNTGTHGTGGTTPMLLTEYSTTISNAHQLQLMALALSANYTLANDIDATATNGAGVWGSNGFVPIGTNESGGAGAFGGTLDGQNHVIDGLFIDSDPSGTHGELSWVGLFGFTSSIAAIENVGLSNVNITSNNTQNGFAGVGALAGASEATITNVWSSGTVTASQVDLQNAIVGGLVGTFVAGTISNSHSSATVSASAGGVNAVAGGLIGENYLTGTVTNSYATGHVSAGLNGDAGGFIGAVFGSLTITDSYATGAVSDGNSGNAGGFVGTDDNSASTISRSFAIGNVTGAGNGEYGGFAGSTNGHISEAYAGGNVSKTSGSATGGDLGGFIGGTDQSGVITKSYATGSVTGDSTATLGGFVGSNGGNVDESYTLSKVTGGEAATTGAFVGNNNTAGSIGATINDYYDTDINGFLNGVGKTSGSGTVTGLIGMTGDEMRDMNNFTGWTSDFGTTAGGDGWVIVDQDDSYNNDTGQTGGTTPMLLSEWSKSIASAHQLQLMELDPTANYTLASDVDAGGTSGSGDVWGSGGFIPVGSNSASGSFTGTFDGAGHTISNPFIDYTDHSGVNRIGLFGLIGPAGTVENVILTDADVTSGVTTTQVGALVGDNEGTVSNATVTGSVTGGDSSLVGGAIGQSGGTVSQASFSGTVTQTGNSSAVGGLIGLVEDGEVTNSFAAATVTGGSNGEAGGFVGQINAGAIHSSYATGNVFTDNNDLTGGFAGKVEALIDTSYSTGNASNTNGGLVGGFAGAIAGSGDIEESYEKGIASGNVNNTAVGGFVAQNLNTAGTTKADYYNSTDNTAPGILSDIGSGSNVVGISRVSMQNSASFTAWAGDFGALGSGAVWVVVDVDQSLNNAGGATGGTTPMLLGEYSTTITSAHQLQLMQLDPTADYTVAVDINAGDTAHSVDVWSSHGFVPVGDDPDGAGFTGSFDGGDHTITGLTIQNASVSGVGLFSFLDEGGTISNVTLTNVSIVATGGNLDAGAIVGFSNGAISNVTVSGSVSAFGSDSDAGGVVGSLNGSLSNAHSSATVSDSSDSDGQGAGGLVGFAGVGSTITQSSATGNVSMDGDDVVAGGLVGFNGGTITQSFATGSVTVTDPLSSSGSANGGGGFVGVNDGGTITNSYAMGNVSITGVEGQLGGGFVGENEHSGSIADSYSLGTVGAAISGGFVGIEDSGTTITNSYWDTQTSAFNSSQGIGNGTSGGLTGVTTATLEGGLSNLPGFSGSVWGVVTGLSMPYLQWQFPSGTPQVVSGFMVDGIDGNPMTGQTVSLMQSGSNLNSALTGGSVVSYADGFFYFLLAPGSITSSGNAGLIAYDAAQHAEVFADQANDSTTDLILTKNYLLDDTSRTTLSALNADLLAADGGTNPVTTPNLKIAASGNFSINQALNQGSGTVLLKVDGGSVNASGTITASKLLLEGAANYTLSNAANSVGTLAMSGDGSLLFVDNHGLAIGTVEDVNGVDAGGGVSLTTTTGGIGITQQLQAESHPLTLTSAAAIAESGAGFIDGTALTATSHGAITLNGNNIITDMGAFEVNGDNAISLKDTVGLTVTGQVDAGDAALTLTTTGSGHAIVLKNTLIGDVVTLNSAASISEVGAGVIDSTELAGAAHGNVVLNNASNDVLIIQSFTTAGNNFAFVDSDSLSASVNAGAGNVSLTTKGSGHGIDIGGPLTGNTVTLVSADTIGQVSGASITATTLTGSAGGETVLQSANNAITNLGAFTAHGAFEILDRSDLTVTGAVKAGANEIQLQTNGNGHDILIDNTLSGAAVNLFSAATIVENSGGEIDATGLSTAAVGNTILNSATNAVAALGAIEAEGNFSLVDATDLTIAGALDAGSNNVKIVTTGSGHDMTIQAEIQGGTVNLVSGGNVSETGAGEISATTLTGSAAGLAKLASTTNQIANLGAFSATGGFTLVDDSDLKTTGTINAGAHAVSLTTRANGHGITIASKVEGGTVKLTAADTISEASAGEIDATTLTGASGKSTALTSAQNDFAKLGAFSSGSTLSITDGASLTTTGTVNAGSHVLNLTTVGANHNLQIASALTGGTVNLNVTGAASETNAGAIKTNTLNVTAGTGITLTSTKNKIIAVGTDKTKTGPNKITK